MKTLIVMAHFDDEVISCPEYLVRNPGSIVFVACGNDLVRSDAFNKVVDETLCHRLGANFKPLDLRTTDIPALAQAINAAVINLKITRIITHHPRDIHQDHQIVNQAVQVALRRAPTVELFYVKNPEGFPFECVQWDTMLHRSEEALQLAQFYDKIKIPPQDRDIELYQTVRRFSI